MAFHHPSRSSALKGELLPNFRFSSLPQNSFWGALTTDGPGVDRRQAHQNPESSALHPQLGLGPRNAIQPLGLAGHALEADVHAHGALADELEGEARVERGEGAAHRRDEGFALEAVGEEGGAGAKGVLAVDELV